MGDADKAFDNSTLVLDDSEVKWKLTREERIEIAIRLMAALESNKSRFADCSPGSYQDRIESHIFWINDIARSTGIKNGKKS